MTHVLIFFTIWTLGWILIALHCYTEWKKTLPPDDGDPPDSTEQSEVQ